MKNIILIVADSLRRDTSRAIVSYPDSLPLTEYEVTACNSCTELSLPWMLSGMDVFSPTMSIPSDMKKVGYYPVMIHSNPVVDRFKAPFDLVIDLGNKKKMSKNLKRFNRIARYAPMWLYKLAQGNDSNGYLQYARVKQKLEAYAMVADTVTEKPLFVWLHLMDPHTPYYPEGEDFDEVVKRNRNQINAVRAHHIPRITEVSEWKNLYKTESEGMYSHLVPFFESLDYTKNTVIFTSDHGEEFGEHEHYGHKGNRFNPENVEVPFFIIGEDLGAFSIESHEQLRPLVKHLLNPFLVT